MNLNKHGMGLATIGGEYVNRHHIKNDILAHCRELLHINDTRNITLTDDMKEALDIKFENELTDLNILIELYNMLTIDIDDLITIRINKFLEKIEKSHKYNDELRKGVKENLNKKFNEDISTEILKDIKKMFGCPSTTDGKTMDDIINDLQKKSDERFE